MAECYVQPKDVRELRALVRHRMQLARSTTLVKNRVHSLLDRYGLRREFSDLFGRAGLEWLRRVELKPLDRLLLDSFVEQVECLKRLIGNVDAEIDRNHSLAQRILNTSWRKFLQLLEYKAERARALVVKVPQKGTSKGLSYENPHRDWISANRIKMRGWGSPKPPAETVSTGFRAGKLHQ